MKAIIAILVLMTTTVAAVIMTPPCQPWDRGTYIASVIHVGGCR